MTEDSEWNIDMEVNLFHAMRGHKPAGVNKHFQMIAIHDKFSSSSKKVSSEDIWKHLSTLYDLQALNDSEIVPFPNKSGDFNLTDKDILELCPRSFPRSSFITSAPTETAKMEANSKSAVKPTKPESKPAFQTPNPKIESKSELKPNSTSKADSRSSTPSSRVDQKSSGSSSSSKSSQNSNVGSTPSPSQNRRQRKRNTNSSSASPATPSDSSAKRRR